MNNACQYLQHILKTQHYLVFLRSDFATTLRKVVVKLLSPLAIGVIVCVVFGIYSVMVGQSSSGGDLQNYHYYSGFALWKGFTLWEIEQQPHVMPAQIQTFFNPLISLPTYLLITYFPPIFVGFLLGFLQGLNFLFVYLLARQILSNHNNTSLVSIKQSLVSLAIAAVGITAPMFISEIGATFGDNLTSILVLAALLFAFKKPASRLWLYPLISGVFIGMAAGLKLPNIIFLIAIAGCGWWYTHSNLRQIVSSLGFFLIGASLAFLLFQGYWSWYLFQEYQNPFFPFFNNFFQSPQAYPVSYRDTRFLPHSFIDALSYPFQLAFGYYPSSEVPFRDLRFALLNILFFLSIPIVISRIIQQRSHPLPAVKINLIFFFLISYSIWIFTLAIQRYIVALELLSGLIIYLFIELIIKTPKNRLLVFVPLAVLLVVTTSPASWGRIFWGPSWFDVEISAELTADKQLFIMFKNERLSYIIPFFPPDSRFFRIVDNKMLPPRSKLVKHMRQTIEDHDGPIYSLGYSKPIYNEVALLENYGLMMTQKNCVCFNSKLSPLITACPLQHVSSESE